MRDSVRRDLGVFSSLTTSRVRRPEEASRFLTRLTPCVTRSVPAFQSSADQCRPSTLTAAHPVGQSQHDRGLEAVSGRCLQELQRLVDGQRPALLALMRGAADNPATLRATIPSRTACPRARRSTVRMIRTLFEL